MKFLCTAALLALSLTPAQAAAPCAGKGLELIAEDITLGLSPDAAQMVVNLNFFDETFSGMAEDEFKILIDNTACHIITEMLPTELQTPGQDFKVVFINLTQLDEYGDLSKNSVYTQASFSYRYENDTPTLLETLFTIDQATLEQPVKNIEQ